MASHERTLYPQLEKAVGRKDLVLLTGPAGSGKSALLKRLITDSWTYIDLKEQEAKRKISDDPDLFFFHIQGNVAIDSIEKYPDLALAVARSLKNFPGKRKYLISGTVDPFSISGMVTYPENTLPLKLFPMSMREISGQPEAVLPWEDGRHLNNPFLHGVFLWENLLKGGMPQLITNRTEDPANWFSSALDNLPHSQLADMRRKIISEPVLEFMRYLAEQTGKPLNLSELARKCRTSLHIAAKWLYLLAKVNQVMFLSPYPEGKRSTVVKTEKAYFTNTGLLCSLLGIKTAKEAMESPFAAVIFESAVINEIMRTLLHRGIEPELYYWRKSTGTQVSIVVKNGYSLEILDTSLSHMNTSQDTKGLRFMKRDLQEKVSRAWLVNPQKTEIPASEGIYSIPFSRF